MNKYTYLILRQKPDLKEETAKCFHDKWVAKKAYLEAIEAYLNNETEYAWYLSSIRTRLSVDWE